MATILTVSIVNANNNNNKHKRKQKKTVVVTPAPCITHATIAGQAVNRVAWQSQQHHLQ
jgi:hypothetical protein